MLFLVKGCKIKATKNSKGRTDMVDDRIGKKIQEYREKAGKSQEELADFVGISVTSVSNIERGANYPSFENFIKILNFIDASPNVILHGVVESAQVTKASELWARMKKISPEKRNLILKVVEVLLEK